MARKKYTPYVPTPMEMKVDGVIRMISPRWAHKRAIFREATNRFSYEAARSQPMRKNANPQSASGETQRGNRDRLQMMWNAIELIENLGLAWKIRSKICDYVCGTIRWQSRTGDDKVNTLYEDYLKERTGRSIDVAGRKTLRTFARTAVGGMVVKGDAGIYPVREGKDFCLQGIEADRIGHPYEYKANRNYIGGVHLTDFGRHEAYDIYTKDRRNGNYYFEETVPARNEIGLPNFFLCVNPITFDDVRGRTAFKATIDNAAYLHQIKQYELQALAWAASQSGIYHTKDGNLPEEMPFRGNKDVIDEEGNTISSFTVTPNTVQAVGVGEDVSMFQHDRPSPNVVAMYREGIRDICNGVDLTYPFVYDMSGISGPAVRGASAQDKRSLENWKTQIGEDFLYPVIFALLGDGIDAGDIPAHPRWNDGKIIFPAHPTIDMGRESAANLNEYAAGITSGSEIAEESAGDIEEIQEQCGHEAQRVIRIAKRIAKEEGIEDFREVLPMIRAGKANMMSPQFESARATQLEESANAAAEKGATTEGQDMQ